MMLEALREARDGLLEGEVPIGAVVVIDGEILGRGHNRKESLQDPTAHAETIALREASARVGSWRLEGATLYATAEPCLMCLGAALQARVGRIVYGCPEPKFGAVRLMQADGVLKFGNHRLTVVGGVLQDECAALLKRFFATKR